MAITFKSHIDLGGLQLQKAALHPLSAAPSNPVEGQVYWNTGDDKLYVSDGTNWIDVSGDVRQIDAGTGISVSGGSGGTATVSLSHLGIQSLTAPESDAILFYDTSATGSAWLSPSSSTGITIDGTTLKLASIPNASLTNSAVTVTAGNGLTDGGSISLGGSATLNVGAGTGISVAADAVALKNASNLTDTALTMWDDESGQLTDSSITDDGSNVNVGSSSDTRNLVVSGNLTVEGTTTTVDSNTVNIGDSIITLNSDETQAATQDGGIEIERGTDTNVTFLWKEGSDYWEVGGSLGITTVSESTHTSDTMKMLVADPSDSTNRVRYKDLSDVADIIGVGNFSIMLDTGLTKVSKSGNVYTVTHGLNSKYVMVEVLDKSGFETIMVDVARPTVNTVTVSFASAPTNNQYICMVSKVANVNTDVPAN